MDRKEFLHCHMCAHCTQRWSRDLVQVSISLCDIHHWPTYRMDCKDFAASDDEAHAWARNEYNLRENHA